MPPDKDLVSTLLGIEHEMTWNGLFECLPPVYTDYIGRELIAHLASVASSVQACPSEQDEADEAAPFDMEEVA